VVYIHGNIYPVDRLKYDLSNHKLVAKHIRQNGTSQKVILSHLLVDSFRLSNQLFVNQHIILDKKGNSSYLEQIFTDKLSFYRIQKKVFNANYNSITPYGKYSDLKSVFYLLLNGEQHKITRKKEFFACFPMRKHQINKYMKDNSFIWKEMTSAQFSNLLKFCNDKI